MINIVRRFTYDDSGDPMANLRVHINDLGPNAESTNIPLKYTLLTTGAVMRDNLTTDENGAIAVAVEDVNGFEIVLIDVDGSVAYRDKVVPGVFHNLDYVETQEFGNDQPIAIFFAEENVEIDANTSPIEVPYSILYASGERSTDLNNTGSGGDGPYLCDFEVDEEAGVIRITLREDADIGVTRFYISSDLTGQKFINITVLPS